MDSIATTATLTWVAPDYATRLRRARLGLLVALTPILMVFVSFTSAYIVRQGLPTLDPQTNLLVKDWIPIKLPTLLLVNTFVLLLSSLGMELARPHFRGVPVLSSRHAPPRISPTHPSKIPSLSI